MKHLFSIALLAISLSASAMNLKAIAGTYKITNDLLPIINVVTLGSDGSVTLVETGGPFGSFECFGSAKIEDFVLVSEVTCPENGQSFYQEIDLEGVENFNSFTAEVFSSLYGIQVPMNFEKIK